MEIEARGSMIVTRTVQDFRIGKEPLATIPVSLHAHRRCKQSNSTLRYEERSILLIIHRQSPYHAGSETNFPVYKESKYPYPVKGIHAVVRLHRRPGNNGRWRFWWGWKISQVEGGKRKRKKRVGRESRVLILGSCPGISIMPPPGAACRSCHDPSGGVGSRTAIIIFKAHSNWKHLRSNFRKLTASKIKWLY